MAYGIQSYAGFWWRWTFACGFGEFLGIGAAAGIGLAYFLLAGEPETVAGQVWLMALAVIAGIIEGLITGFLQWSVLRQQFEDMRAGRWLFFTAFGAAVAWVLGMLYPTFFAGSGGLEAEEPSLILMCFIAGGLGMVLGAVFGFFQWLEMRRHTLGAGWWIIANMVAWLFGMVVIFIGASIPGEETAIGTVILIGAASGLVAGLMVGVITGIFLVRAILPRYSGTIVLG